MRKFVASVALGVLALVSPPPGFAQTSEEMKDVRKQLDAIQKDLQELKTLIRARPAAPAPPRVAGEPGGGIFVGIEGSPTKGDKNAKVTIVEFTDYQ
jgi:protein-disulfide isomerase